MSRILPAGVPAGTPDRDFEQEPDPSGEITNAERATNAAAPEAPRPGAAGRGQAQDRPSASSGWSSSPRSSVLGLVFAYPFVWLVSASFKPRGEVFDNKLIPETFTFDNYINVWSEAPLGLWLLNTLIVTVLAAVTVTISSAMVAWGFSYFRFRGAERCSGWCWRSMMLPGAVTMIPTFLIWNSLGMVGTLTPLWAGNLFGSAFYIFLIRQFMLGLPRDLFEAARVDGASQWAVFWRIALPLTKPALAVTLVFEVQAVWTDLMRALIYLRDSSTFTDPARAQIARRRSSASAGSGTGRSSSRRASSPRFR